MTQMIAVEATLSVVMVN
ncbi:hypothetical protein Avbf_15711 [Armadillidium vulgare]|nr:hypothetical protein Avbf_15711 [Armadillidium vulgare]